MVCGLWYPILLIAPTVHERSYFSVLTVSLCLLAGGDFVQVQTLLPWQRSQVPPCHPQTPDPRGAFDEVGDG